MIKKLFTILFGLFVLTSLSHAETYKVYVAYAPGSPSDIYIRKMFDTAQKYTADNYVVINKPGADQMVGYQAFIEESKTNPNVLFSSGTASHVSSYLIHPELKQDPLGETRSIIAITKVSYFLVGTVDSPFNSIKDIKGKVNIGVGNASSAALLKLVDFNADVQLIPYKSDNDILMSVLSKEIPVGSVLSINNLLKVHKDRIKVIGHLDDFGIVGAVGVHAPKTMSDERAKQLNATLNQVFKDADFKKWWTDTYGLPLVGGAPEAYDRLINNFKQKLLSKQ